MCLCATGHWQHPDPAGHLWASRPCIAPWNDSPGAACTTGMAGSVGAFGTLKYLGIAVPSCTTCNTQAGITAKTRVACQLGRACGVSWIDGLRKVVEAASTKTCNHIVCLHAKETLVFRTQVKHEDLLCPAGHLVCRQCLMVRLQCAAHAEGL